MATSRWPVDFVFGVVPDIENPSTRFNRAEHQNLKQVASKLAGITREPLFSIVLVLISACVRGRPSSLFDV